MLLEVILTCIFCVMISILLMKVIESRSVEGWQDEEGFHLGREEDSGDDFPF
jgi:hypothetical protein